MIFTRRYINVTFVGPMTVKLTRHRVVARVRVSGDPAYGTCQLAIFGMKQSTMNQLSTFGQAIHPQYNYKVIVEAGDAVNGMSTVFIGQIQQAWADYQDMPNVPFHVFAYSSGVPGVQRSEGGKQDWQSYSGPTDVAQMMGTLATQMGCKLENGGVNVKLNNPYHFGSPMRQAQLIREAADIMMCIENETLAIWPMDKTRPGGSLVINRQTGMIAYPSFTEYGVLVNVEFTRYARYGTAMTIESDVTPANGEWSIVQSDYNLNSLVPKGKWTVTLFGTRPGVNVPYVPKF